VKIIAMENFLKELPTSTITLHGKKIQVSVANPMGAQLTKEAARKEVFAASNRFPVLSDSALRQG